MHPAAKLQFERAACEYTRWRSVPEPERSPAPCWWWQPAMQVADQQEEMPALLCYRLELPGGPGAESASGIPSSALTPENKPSRTER
jgi:hypothetical protein